LRNISTGWRPEPSQEVVARLGIRLDEFPAWACAHLESELASINELARTLRDNGEADALVRQIDDRIAELKIRRSGENAAEVPF
jgi:hypothetical protein